MVELVETMEKSTNPALSRAVQQLLHPSILQFASHPQPRDPNISSLGRCWIALSRVFVDLFVPDAPIDPAAVQQCALELWRHEELTLNVEVELQRQVELRTAGNSSNAVIAYLETRLNKVHQYLAELSSGPLHNKRDIIRLHAFWSEIFQFQTQVISSSKIDSLLGLFEAGDSSAAMREQVIQESVAGFCQRLESVYPDFEDIRSPFQQALLYLRLGLRLVAHASVGGSHNSPDSLNNISTGLVAFPSVRSTAMLSMQFPTNNAEGVPPFRRVLLTVAAIALERSLGVRVVANIRTIETTYEQAFRLWSIDRARENQKNQESESLYRRKALDHDAADEDEIEKQEFLELFPAFEDVMDKDRSLLSPGKNFDLVDSLQIHLLAGLHYSLFGPSSGVVSDAHRSFQDLRITALISLLESQMPSLPDVLDNESITLQLSILRDRLFELNGRRDPAEQSYDFYTDANIQEIKKATFVVESLRNRLEVIIQEWPDQMVLQHLRHRCDGILNLDLHSSVAKVLSALEQLLLQTQDWEMYANRQNTLKDHQQSLTGLIIEWRRLELSSWQMLLQSQAQLFANGASESWFRLYDISVRGALAAADDESHESPGALAQYLNQFVPLLDEFVRSSPLGQYASRMRLLQTFESYVDCLSLAKTGQHCWTLQRIRRLLHATSRYYNLFSPQIVASLSEQRATLEREIQAFIKLASWKDVNVHALKQSAQKTHHNLFKIVRKFRDVMRQPITNHLQPIFAGDSESKHMDMDSYAGVSTATGQPSFPPGDTALTAAHLVDLDRTYQKFDSFITNRIRRSTRLHTSLAIDDLATNIIVTAKGLAGESIPKELSAAKRVKQQKALLVRKRKAWSDMLKELKRGGLSVNLKPDILRQQSDPLWIREQPIFSSAATELISTVKVDLYFDRLHAALPQLRTSLSEHHSDVTTKDLQRAIMLLESGFAHALEARSR
jgi:midasin